MAWSTSDRRDRLPADWPKRRAHTKARAGGRCEWRLPNGNRCPNPGTDCDHIHPGDDHSPGNLQWLCAGHHKTKTADDNAQARAQRVALRPRPTEPHPGRKTP